MKKVKILREDSNLWSRIDGESKFCFLSEVDRNSFHQKRRKPGPCSTSERMESEETLKSGALVGHFSQPVGRVLNQVLADGVVTPGVVVGGVFFARDQLFWVEKLSVRSIANFIWNV